MLSPVYEAEGSGSNGNMSENANATGVSNRKGSNENIESARINSNSNLTNANVKNAQVVNLNGPNMKPLPVPIDELAKLLNKLVDNKFYNNSLFGSNAGTNHYKTRYLPQVKAYLNILSKTHHGLHADIAKLKGDYYKDLPLLREFKKYIDKLAAANIPNFIKPGHVRGGRRYQTKRVHRSRRRRLTRRR